MRKKAKYMNTLPDKGKKIIITKMAKSDSRYDLRELYIGKEYIVYDKFKVMIQFDIPTRGLYKNTILTFYITPDFRCKVLN